MSSTLNLFRPAIREMSAYKSARSLGKTGRVFLDANESPWPASPVAEGMQRYPDPQPPKLVTALADLYGTTPDRLLVGRGADEAIDVLVRSFCEAGKDSILILPPTYGVYEVAASIQGASVIRVPVLAEEHFLPSAKRILAALEPSTKLVFLCSPNNPTGNTAPHALIAELATALEGRAVLVVDEAYIEFADTASFVSVAARHDNVIVLRTLSKAWALAGARCGVAIGHPEVIKVLQKVRAPYPMSAPSTQLALKVVTPKGRTSCNARVEKIRTERVWLADALKGVTGVESVFPSEGNFLLVKFADAAQVMEHCGSAGIVVRDRSSDTGLNRCVRITVGSREENAQLLSALKGEKVSGTAGERRAKSHRATKETSITAEVNLDGTGVSTIDTGLKYFDHMLEQISKHGGFDLNLQVEGDLEVDEHHTVEDTAIVLGECLNLALGDRNGIGRYGFLLPMDEAEAKVSIDLSGRPYLVFEGVFSREFVGELPTELVSHFFRSFSESLRATLHVAVKGENAHHMVEACFKGVGRSLRQAIAKDARGGMPSTKGVL